MTPLSPLCRRPDPLRVAWINIEGGAQSPGGVDHARITRLLRPLHPGPSSEAPHTPAALLAVCEAKQWGANGNRDLLAVARTVSEILHRPYVALLVSLRGRSPLTPALFYDPARLALLNWYDDNGWPGYDDKHDTGLFLDLHTDHPLRVIPRHFDPRSPQIRLEQARLLGRYGAASNIPSLVLGDLNETGDGRYWPTRDFGKTSFTTRASKSYERPDGRRVPHTAAITHLIGTYDYDPLGGADQRRDGCGFWALPELAYATGTDPEQAFLPTANHTPDEGGGEIIDHCLTNRPHVYVPGTYRVHPPHPDGPADSDHRLCEATFDLTARPGNLSCRDEQVARTYRLPGTGRIPLLPTAGH